MTYATIRTVPILRDTTIGRDSAVLPLGYSSACKAQELLLSRMAKNGTVSVLKSDTETDTKNGAFSGFFSHYRLLDGTLYIHLTDIHDARNRFVQPSLEIGIGVPPGISYLGKYRENQKIFFDGELISKNDIPENIFYISPRAARNDI